MKKKIFQLVVWLFLGVLALGFLFFFYVTKDLPDPTLLENRQVLESTKIYDRTGQVLLYEIHGEEKRTTLTLDQIPDYAKQATIAIEDEEFYSHAAIDIRGIIRAFWINLKHGRISQGGSTITQQLAKKAFLSDDRTLTRKARELILATRLEKNYSKEEILGFYLNQVPYGGNAYGIEAAAQTFFKKSAVELSLAEAALLASLPNAPSYYSPWGYHVDELMARKNFVLEKMFQLGYIDQEAKERAQSEKFVFAERADIIRAPHFVIAVQEQLNKKYGESFVETGGLEVITTLNWELQQLAEKVVTEGVARNEELYEGRNGALVAEDPKTGQILALVGSRNYFDTENEGNFNVATQGLRQPGSAMKPFAYIAAFEKGFTPDTVVFDLPTEFAANNPNCPLIVDFLNDRDECYHPENFDDRFRGPVTLREGLAQSINIPSIKTLYLAGLDNTLRVARSFGLTTLTERSRYGLSLVLGGGEVYLSDLVGAYSVLANDGTKNPSVLLLEVTRKRNGKKETLEKYENRATKVIDPVYVRMINDVLSDIETRSGLFSSSLNLTIFPDHEVALKTGTTNDYRDAWALGYTPSLVVGVWAGNNDNTPMKQRGSSILAAIPMWNNFMRAALKEAPSEFFAQPPGGSPEKPILRGQYIVNNEVHSILYYVNRTDPLGPPPVNPEKDSQFENWEIPVETWVKSNLGLLTSIIQNQLINGQPVIRIVAPKNGDFIQTTGLLLNFSAESSAPLSKIEVFLNDILIDAAPANDFRFNYQKQILVSDLKLQNTLRIVIEDVTGKKSEEKIILFR
jgi:1A family penicillin-binding protein